MKNKKTKKTTNKNKNQYSKNITLKGIRKKSKEYEEWKNKKTTFKKLNQ